MILRGKVLIAVAATILLGATTAFAGTSGPQNSSVPNPSEVVLPQALTHFHQYKATEVRLPSAHESSVVHQLAARNTSNDHAVSIVVQAGQTLWSISQEYHTKVSWLEQWNKLNDESTLHIGQHLIVGWGVSGSASLGSRSGSVDAGVAAAAQGIEVTQFAERFLGSPYAWGGTSPSGFDCSGFVMYVYQHFGIGLPHASYEQYGQGRFVSRDALAPGDLVFFSTAGQGASHVGIYVGDGKFINATGSGIRYSWLYDGYWSSNYIGARRL